MSETEDLVKLLFSDSILSLKSEQEWVKFGLTDVEVKPMDENLKLIAKVADMIHMPKHSSFQLPKREALQECLSSARYWLDRSMNPINDTKMSYCNLRREAEVIISSQFMESSILPFDYKRCPIGIFWDFENCRIPVDVPIADTVRNIQKSLRKLHYYGDPEIFGAGNSSLNHVFGGHAGAHESLFNQGVTILHVDREREAADKKLIVEMSKWADNCLKYNEGGVIVVITGDVDFKCSIVDLQSLGFKVVLAHNGMATRSLKSPPNNVLLWDSLIHGR